MATIQSSLQIYDRMTGPLMSINNAMNTVISSFENMQTASHGAVDTASLSYAREQLASAEVEITNISRGISQSSQHQEIFNQNISSGSNSMGEMKQNVKGVVAAYLSIQGLKNMLGASDELTQTTARLSLMNDGAQTTSELQNKIFESAQRSRGVYQTTADAVSKLGMQAGKAFSSNDEIIAFSEQLNKTFKISGTSAQGVDSVMLQLTQSMAAGKLQGEELNAVLDNAQPIVQNIATYMEEVMNIDASNIKQLASEGVITAEVIKSAMFYASDETNKKFASIPTTWNDIWNNVSNTTGKAFQPALNKLSEIANSEEFNKFVIGVTNGIGFVANGAVVILDIIAQVGSFLYDNWSVLEPIIIGVVTAFGIYLAVLGIYNGVKLAGNIIEGISNFMHMIHMGNMYRNAAATLAATGAQATFNATLLACPLTWIIIAIIAVVVAIYAIVAAINKVTGSTYSATEIICGAIAAAGAFIINLVIGVLNGIIQLAWTILAEPLIGIVEWILNIMGGGFDSFGDGVKNLLGNIISWFLSLGKVVTKIIDAIFGTDWTSGLSSLQDNVLSWGKNENAITLSREAPEIDYRMEYGDAWNAGKEFGKGIDRALEAFDPSKMSNGSEDAADQIGNPGAYTPTSGTDDALGKINDDTSAIKDSVSVSEEDLKYLREIAEKDAVNRFTTAEIKIDMTNHNTINSDNDIDGVISTLENKLYQSMIVAKEGV